MAILFIFHLSPFIFLFACSRAADQAPYPHESVLTVVMELKMFLAQDPYRRAPGTDLEGRNIYRVSLARLDALKGLTGPEYADVLAFARGECLERLGEWTKAAAAFDETEKAGTKLSDAARQRAASAHRMAEMADRGRFETTLEGYLNDLEVLERRLDEWAESKPAFPYESLARAERERAQEERLRLLLQNRLVLKDGVARAAAVAAALVEQNGGSWRVNQDRLLQGEMFETLARDLTAANRPEGMGFKAEAWTAWVERAREAYRQVAQADGDPAKPEGQARLRVLDTYAMRIKSQAK
ncbi:hypothetical protein LLG95_05980 [bacterium]|nr:hypothetical protein [bacterium]